ncbi:MAG: flagellar biosynthesis protein FliQ [Firmicutes bacterium]|nr:flagellar biosynthesis protein FliQ [Bacillota bacterium]
MSEEMVIGIVQEAVKTVILTSAPPLLLGLIVGLIVSIFQTVTSINEQTLSFIPKILAVFVSLVIFGSFMLGTLEELFIRLFSDFSVYIK